MSPTLLPAKYLKGLLKSIKAKSPATKIPKMFYNDDRQIILQIEIILWKSFGNELSKLRQCRKKKSIVVLFYDYRTVSCWC